MLSSAEGEPLLHWVRGAAATKADDHWVNYPNESQDEEGTKWRPFLVATANEGEATATIAGEDLDFGMLYFVFWFTAVSCDSSPLFIEGELNAAAAKPRAYLFVRRDYVFPAVLPIDTALGGGSDGHGASSSSPSFMEFADFPWQEHCRVFLHSSDHKDIPASKWDYNNRTIPDVDNPFTAPGKKKAKKKQ